jgi:hypothetical protein
MTELIFRLLRVNMENKAIHAFLVSSLKIIG